VAKSKWLVVGGSYGVLALALGRCPELEVELTRFRTARDVS
jgi:hypothetical protein